MSYIFVPAWKDYYQSQIVLAKPAWLDCILLSVNQGQIVVLQDKCVQVWGNVIVYREGNELNMWLRTSGTSRMLVQSQVLGCTCNLISRFCLTFSSVDPLLTFKPLISCQCWDMGQLYQMEDFPLKMTLWV